MLEMTVTWPRPAAQVADHRAREVDEALRDPAVRHELAGEIEERDRQQEELIGAGAELLRDDDERDVPFPDEIADGHGQHRVGDGDIQREQKDEGGEKHPDHSDAAIGLLGRRVAGGGCPPPCRSGRW